MVTPYNDGVGSNTEHYEFYLRAPTKNNLILRSNAERKSYFATTEVIIANVRRLMEMSRDEEENNEAARG